MQPFNDPIFLIILLLAIILLIAFNQYKHPERMGNTANPNIWTPQQWVTAHNATRAKVNANLPMVTWDNDLAKDALEYATNGPTPDERGVPSHPCTFGPGHS